MSNKPPRARKPRAVDVVKRIAAATHERPEDVKAAIAALMADGVTYDAVWDVHLRDAINGYADDPERGGVVAHFSDLLDQRAAARSAGERLALADSFVSSIERALKREAEPSDD